MATPKFIVLRCLIAADRLDEFAEAVASCDAFEPLPDDGPDSYGPAWGVDWAFAPNALGPDAGGVALSQDERSLQVTGDLEDRETILELLRVVFGNVVEVRGETVL